MERFGTDGNEITIMRTRFLPIPIIRKSNTILSKNNIRHGI